MSEPQVRAYCVPYRGKTHYTVEIVTPYKTMQVGISPEGHRITPYPAWKTQPGHYQKESDVDDE